MNERILTCQHPVLFTHLIPEPCTLESVSINATKQAQMANPPHKTVPKLMQVKIDVSAIETLPSLFEMCTQLVPDASREKSSLTSSILALG